jgi:hypothetical protein
VIPIRHIVDLFRSLREKLPFRKRKASLPVPEHFKADLEQAVHAVENRKYAEALKTVDIVLSQDPAIPVAVYLKARIVWEGFRYSLEAKQCLKQVFELVPDRDHPLHRMALELLSRIEKPSQSAD